VGSQPSAAAAGTIDVGGDLTVNRMGYGAMRITGDGIWGEPKDREVAKAALRRAVDLGCNFIDTADSYGPDVSETLIAETLYPYADDLVIASKGGLVRPGPGRWDPDGRPEHLREALEGSLRRLRLDQIPLYQFHRPDPKVPFAESVGALAALKDEGKIRHIGLSNVNEAQLREAQAITAIVSVQNRYNAGDRASQSVADLCDQEQIVFIPWAPIQNTDRNVGVRVAAETHGATPNQIVLAWLLAQSSQTLPIPGSGSADHVEENIAATSLQLTAAEQEAIMHGA
jgi:aryl-alcohol dehydrogenase-like predicted oxidoreductase